jgi:hypothetical protein
MIPANSASGVDARKVGYLNDLATRNRPHSVGSSIIDLPRDACPVFRVGRTLWPRPTAGSLFSTKNWEPSRSRYSDMPPEAFVRLTP